MNAPDYPFTWRLTPRSDSKYPVRAANFAVIYCFITQTQKMGQKRPTAAALCLFLTIRPRGKNYEHEKICPSSETIDVKTLELRIHATKRFQSSIFHFPVKYPRSKLHIFHRRCSSKPLPLVGDVGRPLESRGLCPVRPLGECGRWDSLSLPPFSRAPPWPGCSPLQCRNAVLLPCPAQPSPVCLWLVLNLKPLAWSYFWSTYSDIRPLMSTLTLGGYRQRQGTLTPNHHRNHYPTAIIRKWKPYSYLNPAEIAENK